MKIVLIQSPNWILETPPYNLGLLKSLLISYGYECFCFDLNIELFDYYKNTEQAENWLQAEKRSLWYDEKCVWGFFNNAMSVIDKWLKKIIEIEPKVVGFTVQLSSLFFSVYLSERIKKILPQTVIIFGGPAAHRNCKGHEIISRFSWIDAVCWGEAEVCLPKMLNIINTKKRVDYCKGFAIRDNNDKILDCGDTPLIKNLDSLPFADFADFPLERYTERRLPISTSRGCTYKCIFCNERLHWRKYRFRSAHNIYKEIAYQLRKHPRIKNFFFNDSLLNGNSKVLKELSRLLIENYCGITWSGQATVKQEMKKDFLFELKLSGCDTLIYGIESGSDKILKLMGKPFTSKIAEWCLQNTYEAKINANFNILVGFPKEGEEEFQETVEFLKRNIKYAKFIALTMFYCNADTELFSKKAFFNIEIPDIDNWHALWYTKDKNNTYEKRLHRLKLLRDLCEDRRLWDPKRISSLDTKEEIRPVSSFQGSVEAVSIRVYEKGEDYLLSAKDNIILERTRGYMSKDQFDNAILELKKILDRLPNEPHSLCLLGEIYVNKCEYEKAKKMFRQVIGLYPGFSWVAYRGIGNLHLKIKNKEEAFRNFDKAINLANNNKEIGYIYFDIAQFFISENKKEAIDYLKKAIEVDPNNNLYNEFLKKLTSRDS